MNRLKTDLSKFNNSDFDRGANFIVIGLWYLVSAIFFKSSFFPLYSIKRSILRLFGAKIGKGVVIKPSVNIKYPWFLYIGNYSWIGEDVWIDNLAEVSIGSHACLSQGVLLLTGNHDYKSETFDLIVGKISLEDGVWIGAKSIVGPGTVCKSHSVLSLNSVATSDMDAYTIYQGNPAQPIRKRTD